MFKKMLKGILTVASICALSTGAYAGTKTSAWAGASLGSVDGTITSTLYGKIMAKVEGEKMSSYVEISSFPTNAWGQQYVTYKAADNIDITIGKYNDVGTWGFCATSSWHIPASYAGDTYKQNVARIWSATGINADIKLDSMKIKAGMANDSGTLNPYAWAMGSMGDLAYALGYAGGQLSVFAAGGMVAAVNYTMGDLQIGVDVGMPTSGDMGYGVGVKYANLGPGNLDVTISSSGSSSETGVNYQISPEPGKFIDIFYGAASSNSEMGVSFFTLF